MWNLDSTRPTYYDGQYLGVGDFDAEQDYHRSWGRRHNHGPHTIGIICGLTLEQQARTDVPTLADVFIAPGVAVDGYGREVLVTRQTPLAPELFARFPLESWVAVWIRYDTSATTPPAYGYGQCDTPNATTRALETFTIEVGTLSPLHDAVDLGGTDVTDDSQLPITSSVPYQGLPDDTEQAVWLLQLGMVHWNGTDGFLASAGPSDDQLAVTGRQYAGDLSAHTFVPGGAWELGGLDADVGGTPSQIAATIHGTLTAEGEIVAEGTPTGLRLQGGTLALVQDTPGADETTEPVMSFSRDDQSGGSDLQIQLGHQQDGKNRLVVNSASECFAVADNGDVTVTGTLAVQAGVDVTGGTGDRVLMFGDMNGSKASALGTLSDQKTVIVRSSTEIDFYIGNSTDDTYREVQITGDGMVIGGDLTVGSGTSRVLTRAMLGSASGSDPIGQLNLNWGSTNGVYVGDPSSGVATPLYVTGPIFYGVNQTPITNAIDVKVGVATFSFTWPPDSSGAVGSSNVQVTSRLAKTSGMDVIVMPTNFANYDIATNARWHVYADAPVRVNDNTWSFNINWEIWDDGTIDNVAYIAVFTT